MTDFDFNHPYTSIFGYSESHKMVKKTFKLKICQNVAKNNLKRPKIDPKMVLKYYITHYHSSTSYNSEVVGQYNARYLKTLRSGLKMAKNNPKMAKNDSFWGGQTPKIYFFIFLYNARVYV